MIRTLICANGRPVGYHEAVTDRPQASGPWNPPTTGSKTRPLRRTGFPLAQRPHPRPARGWERVRYVRYQTAKQAQDTYKQTTELRMWGVSGDAALEKQKEKTEAIKGSYKVNQ